MVVHAIEDADFVNNPLQIVDSIRELDGSCA
jgi:hypothetical protein